MQKKTRQKTPINLSRRSVLAGLGGVGLASAGAGLGTSALFSDREDLTGNQLTAGELDLKMDWQQSYYRGLPGQDPDDHTTWQKINAYPDTDDDGDQDTIITRDQYAQLFYGSSGTVNAGVLGAGEGVNDLNASQQQVVEEAFRDQFADLPDDFADPVIDLDDVKPGDKGEITISFHLFDNPGYIWLGGELIEDAENSVNEPESSDPDEDQTQEYSSTEWDTFVANNGGVDDFGELAEEIQVELWYDDDCDNTFDTGPACIQLAVDNTDSYGGGVGNDQKDKLTIDALESFTEWLDSNNDGTLDNSTEMGLTLWANDAQTWIGSTGGSSYGVYDSGTPPTDDPQSNDESDILNILADIDDQNLTSGGGDIQVAINEGAAALGRCPEDSQRILALFTNGVNIDTTTYLNALDSVLRAQNPGVGTVDKIIVFGYVVPDADSAILESVESLPGDHEYIRVDALTEMDNAVNGPLTGVGPDPDSTFRSEYTSTVGAGGGAEEMIATGSLKDVLNDIATPAGYPLDGNRLLTGRQCFPNSTTSCVALKWELPVDHANEVQSDSVEFALRFYTEQCRHNDGTNPQPFNTSYVPTP